MTRNTKHVAVPGSEGHSFCEPVTASSYSRWHIRRLDDAGKRLTGGITTPSLCGHVRVHLGGWDLNVPITEHHLTHCCPECAAKFKATIDTEQTKE